MFWLQPLPPFLKFIITSKPVETFCEAYIVQISIGMHLKGLQSWTYLQFQFNFWWWAVFHLMEHSLLSTCIIIIIIIIIIINFFFFFKSRTSSISNASAQWHSGKSVKMLGLESRLLSIYCCIHLNQHRVNKPCLRFFSVKCDSDVPLWSKFDL